MQTILSILQAGEFAVFPALFIYVVRHTMLF